MKVAIALKDISPIIKKDDRLIKRGRYYVHDNYDKPEKIPNDKVMPDGRIIKLMTPNFYGSSLVHANKTYFRVERV